MGGRRCRRSTSGAGTKGTSGERNFTGGCRLVNNPYSTHTQPTPKYPITTQLLTNHPSLHRWDAYTMLTVPAMCFEPTEASKYLVLEVKLDNPRCAFDVQPNGDIPSDMRWKLTAYASDPAAVEWTVDTARKLFRPNALFVERGRLSQVQGDGSVRQARRGASREGVFRRGERAANPGVPRTLRRHRGARGRQGSSFTGGNRAPRRRR